MSEPNQTLMRHINNPKRQSEQCSQSFLRKCLINTHAKSVSVAFLYASDSKQSFIIAE